MRNHFVRVLLRHLRWIVRLAQLKLASIEVIARLDLLLLSWWVRMNLVLKNAGTRGLLYLIWVARGSLSLNFRVCIVTGGLEPGLLSRGPTPSKRCLLTLGSRLRLRIVPHTLESVESLWT